MRPSLASTDISPPQQSGNVGTIPTLMTGYFKKQGHIRKNWRSRFFVLELGRLSYFEKELKSGEAPFGVGLLKNLALRNVGLSHHDDPSMICLRDGMSKYELLMKADDVDTAEEWRKGFRDHIAFAISFPNACLQTDASQDEFRRNITEKLIYNNVLSLPIEDEESCDDSGQGLSGNDVSTGKFALKSPIPGPQHLRRGSTASTTSEASLNMNFKFEEQEIEFDVHSMEDGSSSLDDAEKDISSDLAQKVTATQLVAIGKQLKELEKESKRAQETKMKDWHREVAPKFKKSIKDLEKGVNNLKKEQKAALKNKVSFSALFEEQINDLCAEIDDLKLKLYFPEDPPVTFGSGGIYFSLDYVWLENLSGIFQLKLSSASYGSQVLFRLMGATSNSGVAADISINNFKLKSEYKGIPSLSLENFKIRVSLRVELLLSFFSSKQKWTATPEQFTVQLLSFKGPFGITRRMVSALLSIAVPALKRQILEALPIELGVFLTEIPNPLEVNGSFHIDGGVVVSELFHGMQKSPKICSILGYNTEQMLNFLGLQKSLDRKVLIKSVLDLLRYRNLHWKQAQWEGIVKLWEQAAIIYYQTRLKLPSHLRESELRMSEAIFGEDDCASAFVSSAFLSFEKLLQGAKEVEKNPLSIRFSLDKLKIHMALLNAFRHARDYYSRMAQEEDSNENSTYASKLYIEKMHELCQELPQTVVNAKKLFDNMQCLFRMHVTSGEDADINILIKEIHTQFPICFKMDMEPESDSPFSPIVPTVQNIRTRRDGLVCIKLFHLGSEKMQRKANFLAFKSRRQLDVLLESCEDPSDSAEFLLCQSEVDLAAFECSGVSANEDMQFAKQAHATQRDILESFMRKCHGDISRVRLLLSQRPEEMSFVKLATANVYRPRVSFIVDNQVSLKPGTALFILQVGADGESQAGHDLDDDDDESMMFGRKDMMMGDSVRRSRSRQEAEEMEKGAQISAQGTNGLKLEAHVPEIRFQGKVLKLLQFFAHHLDDPQLLADYLDETEEKAKQRIKFFTFLFETIGKHVLLPNCELLLNLEMNVSTQSDDMLVNFATSAKYSPALNFFVKLDIMELLQDITYLKQLLVAI